MGPRVRARERWGSEGRGWWVGGLAGRMRHEMGRATLPSFLLQRDKQRAKDKDHRRLQH